MSSPREPVKPKPVKEVPKDVRKASVTAGSDVSSSPDKKLKEAEKTRKKGNVTPVIISGTSMPLAQGSGQTRPLPAHAGIQFESYEKTFTAKTVSRDPLPALVTWPHDDIVVEEQKRKLRTSKPTLPVRPRSCGLCVCVTFRTFFLSPRNSFQAPIFAPLCTRSRIYLGPSFERRY